MFEREPSADRQAERVLLLALLDHDRPPARLEDLVRELDLDARTLERAVLALVEVGLVLRGDAVICASPAARRMDALGLVAV